MPAADCHRLRFAFLFGLLAVAAALPAQGPQTLTSDLFEITVSPEGAAPIAWRLTRPDAGLVALLDEDFVEASGQRPLTVVLGGEDDRRTYGLETEQQGQATLLRCTSPIGADGLQITKVYSLLPGNHVLGLAVSIENHGKAAVELGAGERGPGLTLGPGVGIAPTRVPGRADNAWLAWVEPFVRTPEELIAADVPSEPPFHAAIEGTERGIAWGGLQSPYLAIVLLPAEAGTDATAETLPFVSAEVASLPDVGGSFTEDDVEFYPVLTLLHPPATLAPGETWGRRYQIYAGPKDRDLLAAAAPELGQIVFHDLPGWLSAICIALRAVLGFLYGIVHDWGLSLILFAVLFRGLTLPLSLYGARSQMLMRHKMAGLKPQMAAIKREHTSGDARNKAVLALYKEHGINPLSNLKGCLPLVIQLPILIGLFQLLLNSPELQGTGFLWIDDLTQPDRLFALPFSLPWLGSSFNLLPVIMLLAQFAITRSILQATDAVGDSGKAMYLLPVVMTLLFWPFPAGCMLFWTTGNVLQVLEQRASAARVRTMLAMA